MSGDKLGPFPGALLRTLQTALPLEYSPPGETLFRERCNWATPFTCALAANTYTVYIIHWPIVVALQYLLHPLHLPPLLAAISVFLLGLPISFLLSHYVVRKIPGTRRIL